MTTQERLDSIEHRQGESELTVAAIRELTNMLVEVSRENRQLIARMDRRIEDNYVMLKEMRRENRQTRRIWIAIARKKELFDDDEFDDVFGDGDDD